MIFSIVGLESQTSVCEPSWSSGVPAKTSVRDSKPRRSEWASYGGDGPTTRGGGCSLVQWGGWRSPPWGLGGSQGHRRESILRQSQYSYNDVGGSQSCQEGGGANGAHRGPRTTIGERNKKTWHVLEIIIIIMCIVYDIIMKWNIAFGYWSVCTICKCTMSYRIVGNFWGRNIYEFCDFTATHESFLHKILGMPAICLILLIPQNAPLLPICESFLPQNFPLNSSHLK